MEDEIQENYPIRKQCVESENVQVKKEEKNKLLSLLCLSKWWYF